MLFVWKRVCNLKLEEKHTFHYNVKCEIDEYYRDLVINECLKRLTMINSESHVFPNVPRPIAFPFLLHSDLKHTPNWGLQSSKS